MKQNFDELIVGFTLRRNGQKGKFSFQIYQDFHHQIPYGSKFPWSNIFVIFVNFALITKIFVTKFSRQQLIVQHLTLQNHEKPINHKNQARSRKFKTTEIWSHTVILG